MHAMTTETADRIELCARAATRRVLQVANPTHKAVHAAIKETIERDFGDVAKKTKVATSPQRPAPITAGRIEAGGRAIFYTD